MHKNYGRTTDLSDPTPKVGAYKLEPAAARIGRRMMQTGWLGD